MAHDTSQRKHFEDHRPGGEAARRMAGTSFGAASQTMQDVSDRFTNVFSLATPEAQRTVRRTSQNLSVVMEAGTRLSEASQAIWREWLDCAPSRRPGSRWTVFRRSPRLAHPTISSTRRPRCCVRRCGSFWTARRASRRSRRKRCVRPPIWCARMETTAAISPTIRSAAAPDAYGACRRTGVDQAPMGRLWSRVRSSNSRADSSAMARTLAATSSSNALRTVSG